MGDKNPIHTLREYSKPSHEGYRITIELLVGNNMEDPEQAFVEYASSRNNNMGNWKFTANQGPRNFNEATNTWKYKPKCNWEQTPTFMSPRNGSISTYSSNYQMKLEKALTDFDSRQEKRLSSKRTQLGQQQDDMTGKINLMWKTREELKKIGIQSPSKLFSPKYLSLTSIIELNKNPSTPKRVHFVNSIVILGKESEAEKGETTTDITPKHGHNITKEAKVEVKGVMEEDERSFTYECDFMILEDTISIIDRHLGEMAFGRPFMD
nr:hypothetical protein [Tanacetum cinerariifolium]